MIKFIVVEWMQSTKRMQNLEAQILILMAALNVSQMKGAQQQIKKNKHKKKLQYAQEAINNNTTNDLTRDAISENKKN